MKPSSEVVGRARPPGAPLPLLLSMHSPDGWPGGPALPRKAGGLTLPVRHPYVIPIFGPGDQTSSYRVLQNVIGLISKALFLP